MELTITIATTMGGDTTSSFSRPIRSKDGRWSPLPKNNICAEFPHAYKSVAVPMINKKKGAKSTSIRTRHLVRLHPTS